MSVPIDRGWTGRRALFRALRYRNYRLFFCGQAVSLIGSWMQSTAMIWLVYRLTGSALLLGVVGFAGHIPATFLTPISGVLADRWNRHRLIVFTQSLAMIQALVLAFLSLAGLIAVGHIVALAFFLGLVNSLDLPTRQSFVVEMLDRKEDLPNAIALNSFLFNSARIVGPSIGGILIAAAGEGVCFLLNALSYVPVIVALLAMRIRQRERDSKPAHILHELREGFAYVSGFMPIRSILLLVALISVLAMSYAVLMPVFAKDILGGGSHEQGFLMAAGGAGAMAGAVYLASRPSVAGLGRIIAAACSVVGVALIGFSVSRVLWLSMALMVLTGFGMMLSMASCNTILQTIVEDSKRGRVMSFYTLAFIGLSPIGQLLAGTLASTIGAPWTVTVGGISCLVGAFLFARQLPAMGRIVRPIYAALEVLPVADSRSPLP